MRVRPYELRSVRNKLAWQDIATQLGLHITIVKEAYFSKWCTGVQAIDFISLVKKGEITREQIVEDGCDFMEMPIAELDRREAEALKDSQDSDFSDLVSYRLKAIVQVGDEVVSEENKTFCFSQQQYQTQGKRYKIASLSDARGGLTEFTAITNADIVNESIHWSSYGIRSLWRNGKEIWNWNLAYLELFKEQNPNHPQTPEMVEHCTRKAKLMSEGKPS